MTFSDPSVSDLLNREFVCAWINSQPALPASRFGVIPRESMEWRRYYPQGTGANNVTMFFCTSDGRVLHHLEGFWAPVLFVRETHYVLRARDRLTVRGREVPENVAIEGMREMHRQAIAEYRSEAGSWGDGIRKDVDPENLRPIPPPDDDRDRRRPVPVPNPAIALLIRFHEIEIANPLRRVEQALSERIPAINTGG